MRQSNTFWVVKILLAIAALVFAPASWSGVARAQQPAPTANGRAYPQPDLKAVIFDVQKISLSPATCTELASGMGSWVRNDMPLDTAEDLSWASRMLGVALRLDPKNKDAYIANARLSQDVGSALLNLPPAVVYCISRRAESRVAA